MLLCLLALLAAGVAVAAGIVPAPPPADQLDRAGSSSQHCWEALMQIKSCTGEIILFLLEGEAYLGGGCCRAVRLIEQRCWAADAMLSVIGFTPQEGDMLKGYCDAGQPLQQHGSEPPPPSSVAVADGDAASAREMMSVFAGRKHGPVRG
ncbi:hypothetical protein PR202_gb19549 [Eleusine coracana subsp. coracana]|uniref:Prolamin-like domain-containing protein n=1 Tax=Eleusine coracana subsp. coracana TaxID=191504 RepID=A0AAV5F685_ELECO|nr:hypothetical protein PR202_gb19549 [Eleusine coracana subsp. coracana]